MRLILFAGLGVAALSLVAQVAAAPIALTGAWRTYRREGVTLSCPTAWDATANALTAVSDPGSRNRVIQPSATLTRASRDAIGEPSLGSARDRRTPGERRHLLASAALRAYDEDERFRFDVARITASVR
jgi:hypothetical protein